MAGLWLPVEIYQVLQEYLLHESDGMDRFVKTIIYREVRLDVNAILERLRALGLYRYAGKRMQAVWPFQPVQRLVRHLYSSLDGGGMVSSFLNAHYLMTYIKRDGNLYSLIVRESRFGGDVRWRYGLRKFLEEKLFPNLTFIDVALTASICLGIPAPLNRLRESLETLKTLGIISENLKPLPYATHITRLFKGYMTKTKLVRNPRDRKEWENILGWRTSTKTAD
jgi:transcription antitermination factor NusG